MEGRIADQFDAAGRSEGGLHLPNTLQWTDREARGVIHAALAKAGDFVTSGQSKPLWMSAELGGLIDRFRRSQFAAMQRITLAELPRRDADMLCGAVLMCGLGMMSYALTSNTAGNDDVSDDLTVWIAEGIDRAGITGWLFEADTGIEQAGRGLFGDVPIVNPTVERVQDARALRRLIPYQNLFYLRHVLDRTQDGLNRTLGAGR